MPGGQIIEWESDEEEPAIEWETEKVHGGQKTQQSPPMQPASPPVTQVQPQAAPQTQEKAQKGSGIKGAFGSMFESIKSDLRLKMNYDSTKLHLSGPLKKQKKNFRYDGDLTVDKYCMLGPTADVDDSLKPMNIIGGNLEVGVKMKGSKKAAAVVNSKLTVGRKLIVHGHLMGNGTIVSGDTEVKGSLHIKEMSTVGNIYANSIRTQVKVETKVGSISVIRSIHSEDDLFAGHSIEVAKGDLYCHDLCDAIEIRCPHGNIDVGRFGLYNQIMNGKFVASRPKLRLLQAGTKWAPGYIRIENESCYNAVMNAFNMGEIKIIGNVVKE
jgi:carbonic anhydrase/acetyltransferase-like protein (isoleucine patch superfamily)